MSKQTRWLFPEIERWIAAGIISGDQASRIRKLYPAAAVGLSWGLIVFFGLGAVIVGLGVILLFAYNWSAIPKFGKLGLIFGALVAAHAGGLVLRARDDWRPKLGEALSLLGTMAFGGGIWLVAQIYNIEEHFPNGFLIWALGALAMAWVLDSVTHGLLAAVLLVCWGATEAVGFRAPVEWSPLLLVCGVGPLVWRLRSSVLLAVVLAGLYFLLLCNAAYWGGTAGVFANALALSVLLVALGKLGTDRQVDGKGRAVLEFFGLGGFLFCSYILSFHDAVRSVYAWTDPAVASPALTFLYRWFVAGLAAASWVCLLVRVLRAERGLVAVEEWLIPIALVYSQGLVGLQRLGDEMLVATVFNLVCLGLATMWMVRGCRESRLRSAVLGSLLLTVVVFARYFDLFDSLAMRGMVFVGFGLVLFAEGFFYRRLRQSANEGSPT